MAIIQGSVTDALGLWITIVLLQAMCQSKVFQVVEIVGVSCFVAGDGSVKGVARRWVCGEHRCCGRRRVALVTQIIQLAPILQLAQRTFY